MNSRMGKEPMAAWVNGEHCIGAEHLYSRCGARNSYEKRVVRECLATAKTDGTAPVQIRDITSMISIHEPTPEAPVPPPKRITGTPLLRGCNTIRLGVYRGTSV